MVLKGSAIKNWKIEIRKPIKIISKPFTRDKNNRHEDVTDQFYVDETRV